ncbi:MAG: UbiD family decarboxylase, partial [Verrucomicrobia bacterium]|nr:UbiD family decarboxylase [Verrucomicrobiota bacterium]
MAFDSFQHFIDQLDRAGELIRITQPVATELEITELADRQMKSPGGGKALLIEKPTVNGRVSEFPLAINTMGSWKRMALSLGANSVDEVAAELGSLMKAKPPTSFKDALKLLGTALDLRHAKPKLVKDGPCKEVVRKFDAPSTRIEPWPPAPEILGSACAPRAVSGAFAGSTSDVRHVGGGAPTTIREARVLPTLLNLPIQQSWPLDGGRFITLPCVVTQDPDTGERNVGMYRIQIYDDRTTGMHWQLQKVGARHGRRYYETGARMPVSIFLGGDPVFAFAATAPLPDGLDEFLLAGYLRKKSIELVKCQTNDLEVPANADFVIEGYVDPTEPLRDEGPFG